MGIRQTLNDNPTLTAALTGVILLGAIAVIVKQACTMPGASRPRGLEPPKHYFTIDDGKTYFPDDARKVPPFDYQGKPAVRVMVVHCPDGQEHASHLERYAPADKKRLEEALAKEPQRHVDQLEQTAFIGVKEVKRPGAKDWVRASAKTLDEYTAVQRPQCPDGATAGVQRVLPE